MPISPRSRAALLSQQQRATAAPDALPFGQHRGQPLDAVPLDYLEWVLRTVKLSAKLHATVAGEVDRRGGCMPPPRMPFCSHCGGDSPHYGWQQMSNGRKHLRVDCGACGRFLTFAPQVEPYTTLANNTASETAALDVLVQCDELGINLHSDGRMVYVGNHEERRRMPRRLNELVRQCSHTLAGLLGEQ